MDLARARCVPFRQPSRLQLNLSNSDDFSTLCFVRADLSPLTASAKAMTGPDGRKYWKVVFSIEIHFGLTEFKARIKWIDDVCFHFRHAFFVLSFLTLACFSGGNKIVSISRQNIYRGVTDPLL